MRTMKFLLAGMFACSALLYGCSPAQSERIYFCAKDGSVLEGDAAFLDPSKNMLVLGDVLIAGKFECELENAVCFHSSETSFEFAEEGKGSTVISNDKSWGGYEWTFDYRTSFLFLRLKREGAKAIRTCDPIIFPTG